MHEPTVVILRSVSLAAVMTLGATAFATAMVGPPGGGDVLVIWGLATALLIYGARR